MPPFCQFSRQAEGTLLRPGGKLQGRPFGTVTGSGKTEIKRQLEADFVVFSQYSLRGSSV
jgi:hypothetical protein